MRTLFEHLLRLLAGTMGLAYLAAGLFLLLGPPGFLALAGPVRVALGLLLCLYGSFRLVRAARKTPGLV